MPGQWDYARRPNKKELAKTSLLALAVLDGQPEHLTQVSPQSLRRSYAGCWHDQHVL